VITHLRGVRLSKTKKNRIAIHAVMLLCGGGRNTTKKTSAAPLRKNNSEPEHMKKTCPVQKHRLRTTVSVHIPLTLKTKGKNIGAETFDGISCETAADLRIGILHSVRHCQHSSARRFYLVKTAELR